MENHIELSADYIELDVVVSVTAKDSKLVVKTETIRIPGGMIIETSDKKETASATAKLALLKGK